MEEVQKVFKPEFINRIDEIIIFESLDKNRIKEIVRLELDKVKRQIHAQNIEVNFDESVVEKIFEDGYSSTYGAREIRRVIQREVENPLSTYVLEGKIEQNKKYDITISDGKLDIVENTK
jgi:ATP-dependent Clp protease ATP-binding subunit ClpC